MARALTVVALLSGLTVGCVIDFQPADEDVQVSTTGTDGSDGTEGTDQTDATGPDNTDTTSGALKCSLTAFPCRTQGPCAALTPECVQGEDGSWTWDCGFDQVEGFVMEEGAEHCDNVDNDCDGVIDDIEPRESDAANCTGGVCEAAPSRCEAGAWICDYSEVTGYEKQELTCDALDNDCDGETDEGVGGTAADCEKEGQKLEGVCGALSAIQCGSDGTLNCDYTAYVGQIPLYSAQDDNCDGLDNDCDGLTDEDADETSPHSPCKSAGPCSDTVTAECVDAAWECDYAAVPGYEDVETACDGLDNDCDGQTDAGPSMSLSTEDCSDSRLGVGVCAAGAVALCVTGATVCAFDNVPDFEQVEASCDGKDNDCDGATDEELTPPVGACSTLGVCKTGLTATCNALGTWDCSYGVSAWEPGNETSCDGLDNDCDGLVDEDIVGTQEDCPHLNRGVCAGQPSVATCKGGEFVCAFATPPAGYEAIEVSCDGKDNDCDGLTDEDLKSVAQSTCKKVGVCSNMVKVEADCSDGQWQCAYDQVAFYEADEASCDGRDNDCDGLVDEDITGDATDVCPPGVCQTAGQAVCQNGTFVCDKASTVGFENNEVSCDALDNDCDGETDEGTCPVGTECGDGSICSSLACNAGPLGEAGPRCCVSSPGRCPGANCQGEFADGQRTCLQIEDEDQSNWYRPICVSGEWQLDPFDDLCESGACEDGQCKTCFPGSVTCDSSGTSLLQCDETGDTQTPSSCPTSPNVTSCVVGFPGICLYHEDQKVDSNNPGDEASGPVVVRTSGTTYHVAWQSESPAGFAISLREVSNIGALTTGTPAPPPHLFSADARSVSMARITPQRTAIAWHQINGGDTTVYMRLLNPASGYASLAAQVNGVSEFEQSTPSVVVRSSTSFIVAYQGQYATQGNGLDVWARPYQLAGGVTLSPGPSEVRINDFTTGTQRRPVGAGHASGRMLLVWESADQAHPGGIALYGRILTTSADGKTINLDAAPFQIAANPAGEHVNAAVTSTADGFVVAWQHRADPSSDDNIYVRPFDSEGNPLSDTDTLLTRGAEGGAAAGDQRRPDIVTTLDGSVVVAWDDVAGDGNGGAVFLRQLKPDLTPVGPEPRRVNLSTDAVIGHQRNPSLAPAGDANLPWVLVAYEHGSGNGADPPVPAVMARPMVLQSY